MFRCSSIFWGIVLLFSGKIGAEEGFGWYSGKCWGWDYGETKEVLIEEEIVRRSDVLEQQSYSDTVKQIREEYEESLARATMELTLENVLDLRLQQQEVVDRMQEFSEAWALVSLLNPELDASVTKRPISSFGIRAVEAEQAEQRERMIRNFSEKAILIYVYEGDRKISRSMGSVSQNLSQKYDWDLVGIAINGDPISDIEACPRPEVLEGFRLPLTPALLAATEEGEVIPIGWGVQSLDSLEENISRFLQHKGV